MVALMSRNRTTFVLIYLILTISLGARKNPKMKTLVFVGATGNGKSSTANSIVRHYTNVPPDFNAFNVSGGIGSCTDQFQEAKLTQKNIKLIDSPGFGDTKYDAKYIDELLKGLTNRVVNDTETLTGNVDAFVMVAKLTPRPSTLKADLEHLISIYGSVSLKSLVLIVIDTDEPPRSPEKIYEGLENNCKELMKPLLAQKNGASIRDWTIYWNNKNPREGQFEELMQKVNQVEPYTHQKFLDAQEEIKDAMNARINAEVEEKTKALREEFAGDKAKMQEEITKVKEASEAERQQFLVKQQSLIIAVQDIKQKMEEADQAHQIQDQAHQTQMAEMTKKLEETNQQHQNEVNQINQNHAAQMDALRNQQNAARSQGATIPIVPGILEIRLGGGIFG